MFEQISEDRNLPNLVRLFRIVALATAINVPFRAIAGAIPYAVLSAGACVLWWVIANGLEDRRRWAQRASYAMCTVALLAIPIGTIAGVIGLFLTYRASKAGAFSQPVGEGEGVPPSRARGWPMLVAAGAGVVAIVVGLLALGAMQQPLIEPKDLETARRSIAQAEADGWLAGWNCVTHRAQVDEGAWQQMNATQRRGLTVVLAGLCEAQHQGARMTIVARGSGQQVAHTEGRDYATP